MTLLKILTLAILLSVSTLVSASLMLTEDDYITVDHNGTDLDWAWASNYNVQYYYLAGVLQNELYAPTVIEGWREATTEEFSFFSSNITASDFLDPDSGVYKIATSFFNSDIFTFSTKDFERREISGTFVEGSSKDDILQAYDPLAVYDTFYVRDSSTSKPIPEPLSIIIFATALFALQIKLKHRSV